MTGAWGEQIAADYLRKHRYEILACNYRCKFGELDIIAQNRKYLIFVEVKLRKSDRFVQAREYVTAAKQDKLRMTASVWLQHNPTNRQPRFDVIEIYAPLGMDTLSPKLVHLEDAFE